MYLKRNFNFTMSAIGKVHSQKVNTKLHYK